MCINSAEKRLTAFDGRHADCFGGERGFGEAGFTFQRTLAASCRTGFLEVLKLVPELPMLSNASVCFSKNRHGKHLKCVYRKHYPMKNGHPYSSWNYFEYRHTTYPDEGYFLFLLIRSRPPLYGRFCICVMLLPMQSHRNPRMTANLAVFPVIRSNCVQVQLYVN